MTVGEHPHPVARVISPLRTGGPLGTPLRTVVAWNVEYLKWTERSELKGQNWKEIHFDQPVEGRKELFYLTMHSTHFIYGYMASDIWLRTILIVRKETRCHHIATLIDYQQGFFYMHHPTDRMTHTMAGARNSSMGRRVRMKGQSWKEIHLDQPVDPRHIITHLQGFMDEVS